MACLRQCVRSGAVVAGHRPRRRPAPCTAEQGQALIDEGRHKQAIRELTCLIDA